jgi:hypothetical protein
LSKSLAVVLQRTNHGHDKDEQDERPMNSKTTLHFCKHVVLQGNRDVDQLARHGLSSKSFVAEFWITPPVPATSAEAFTNG